MMTREDCEAWIVALLKEHLAIPSEVAQDVKLTATLQDLGADSLDRVELAMMIEEEFSIELPDMLDSDDLSETVGDLVTRVFEKVAANG